MSALILRLPEWVFPWIEFGFVALALVLLVAAIRWRMRAVERRKIDAVLDHAARPGFIEEDN